MNGSLTADTLPPGTHVAGYEVHDVLGRGGMGVVYRATQVFLDRTVALKVVNRGLSDDDDFKERFRREGMLQAKLEHPHIVPVYEAGWSEHGLYLAMRYIDGADLKKLLDNKEVGPDRLLKLVSPVAEALDSAHSKGMVHRDVKPQNVLVGQGDFAYLADFGLIKAEDAAGVTAAGLVVGTVEYLSPEQVEGRPATRKSDVYAFATMIVEALTGIAPFRRDSMVATMFAHVNDPPPRPTQYRPDLPPEVDDVVLRGLSKEPDERHDTVSDLVAELSKALAAHRARSGQKAPDIIEPDRRQSATQAQAQFLAMQAPLVQEIAKQVAAKLPRVVETRKVEEGPDNVSATVWFESPDGERRCAWICATPANGGCNASGADDAIIVEPRADATSRLPSSWAQPLFAQGFLPVRDIAGFKGYRRSFPIEELAGIGGMADQATHVADWLVDVLVASGLASLPGR